jgi:hypothetical protein
MEQENNIEILFAFLRGPQVWGWNNAVSNYNFYAFFKTDNLARKYFKINDEDNAYSFRCYNFDYVVNSANEYYNNVSKYPSILYRSEQMNQFVQKQGFEERADRTTNFLFEAMCSDFIWDSGYLKEHLYNLMDEIFCIEILDYYYSKAYGSLKNIFINEEVKGTKYLEGMLEISCMMWILNKKTMPVMDILKILELNCPNEYKGFLKGILKEQKNIGEQILAKYEGSNIKKWDMERPKVLIKRNDEFNLWIEEQLVSIAEKMKLINKSEKILLGDDVMLAKWINR